MPDKKLTRLLIRHCLRDLKERRHIALLSIGALIISSPRRPYAPRRFYHSSINRRLVYILNSKCASTTIRDWIKPSPTLSIPLESRMQQVARVLFQHRKHKNTDKILAAYFPKNVTPFLFSFVRNPLARHVSCYKDKVLSFRKNKAKPQNINKLPGQNKLLLYTIIPNVHHLPSFETFTLAVASTPDCYANVHIKSQYAALYENGNLIPDYIGKVEHFERDACYLCNQFNLPPPPEN